MSMRRRFAVDIILVCVRWYCKYGISYRDLAEMMQERGADVDPSTIMRWGHRYAPELEKRVRYALLGEAQSGRRCQTVAAGLGKTFLDIQIFKMAHHRNQTGSPKRRSMGVAPFSSEIA